MAGSDSPRTALDADWLGLCRRATEAARAAVALHPTTRERARTTGRGEGGDMTLVIDRAAEDAIFSELDSLELPLTAISEERGRVELAGGDSAQLVIDPIDGSLNAKRGLPFYAVSIAVADGDRMGDVRFGYVGDLGSGEEWWAVRGGGAFLGGERLPPLEGGPLEIVGLETARPSLVAAAAGEIAMLEADRVRAIGSVALSLCFVAAGRLDGMASLRAVRSVDVAAAQLLVCEAGGIVDLPEAEGGALGASLDLGMRSCVIAASTQEGLERLRGLGRGEARRGADSDR